MEGKIIILPQIDKEMARQRNEQIVSLVKRGVKPAEVARLFKLSRQRVDQILKASKKYNTQ